MVSVGNGTTRKAIWHSDGILEEIMNFFEWYGSGLVILLILFAQQAYRVYGTIKKAAYEVYDILIRGADKLSTSVILLVALLGPLLLPIIAYFQFRSWQNGLAVDEDDNREYPWSKE